MKILICGAGIQGQYLSAHLQQNGAEVSLLARGQKVKMLQEKGIRYQVYPNEEIHEVHVSIVTEVTKDYDIIFVIMQKQQAMAFSQELGFQRGNATVVFLGNNGTNIADYETSIPTECILLGFLLIGGCHKETCMQVVADEQLGITLGAHTDEGKSQLNQVIRVLEKYNMVVDVPSDIDAWLKSHLALVLPLVGAVYGADTDNYRLSKTPALLKLTAKGLKEAYKVVRKCGYPFLPRRLAIIAKLPERLLVRMLRTRLAATVSDISLAGHARAARSEMQHLAKEFQHLVDESGLGTPSYDRLIEFLDSETPVIDEGAETLS